MGNGYTVNYKNENILLREDNNVRLIEIYRRWNFQSVIFEVSINFAQIT